MNLSSPTYSCWAPRSLSCLLRQRDSSKYPCYSPSLRQSETQTGLPSFGTPDNTAYPRHLLYSLDYLPHKNKQAQIIVEEFPRTVGDFFNMTTKEINLTSIMSTASEPAVNAVLRDSKTGGMWTYDQWE